MHLIAIFAYLRLFKTLRLSKPYPVKDSDRVLQDGLLYKFCMSGTEGRMLAWLRNYVCDLNQRIHGTNQAYTLILPVVEFLFSFTFLFIDFCIRDTFLFLHHYYTFYIILRQMNIYSKHSHSYIETIILLLIAHNSFPIYCLNNNSDCIVLCICIFKMSISVEHSAQFFQLLY